MRLSSRFLGFSARRTDPGGVGRPVLGAGVGRRPLPHVHARGVARTAPFTHAGTLSTLADVIRHDARRGLDPADPRAQGAIDPDLLPRHTVTDEEVVAVVAFLEALNPE